MKPEAYFPARASSVAAMSITTTLIIEELLVAKT
jgi:hypothetical protein